MAPLMDVPGLRNLSFTAGDVFSLSTAEFDGWTGLVKQWPLYVLLLFCVCHVR